VFGTARASLAGGLALAGGAPLARQRDIAEERSDQPTAANGGGGRGCRPFSPQQASFGTCATLAEAQIEDLVARLMRPDSPVDRD